MTETTADSTRRRAGEISDPSLETRAAAALSALFGARPDVSADLEEAGRAHAHLERERQREADALVVSAGAMAGLELTRDEPRLERAMSALFSGQ